MKLMLFFSSWFDLGIGGLEDMKLTCGTIAAEEKAKVGKGGKVILTVFILFSHLIILKYFEGF